VSFTEMSETVLVRALEPFPIGVRTLDALHLATMAFIRGSGETVELASYDRRPRAAAQEVGISIAKL
jgi:predicted nucleic acid-binding protein